LFITNPVGCVSPKPLQASTIALDDQNGQTIGFRGMQLLPTIRMALGELYVSDYSKDTCILEEAMRKGPTLNDPSLKIGLF